MSIVIRNSMLKDFSDIVLLFRQLWSGKEINETELKKVFTRGIQSGIDYYFCAELNEKIVGFCSYSIVNNFWQEGYIAYVHELIVDKNYRGQNIGINLLNIVFNEAKLKGCKKVELDSAFNREKAHIFYEKIGFEKRAYLFSKDI